MMVEVILVTLSYYINLKFKIISEAFKTSAYSHALITEYTNKIYLHSPLIRLNQKWEKSFWDLVNVLALPSERRQFFIKEYRVNMLQLNCQ